MPARPTLLAAATAAVALALGAQTVPAAAADASASVISRGVRIPEFYNPPSTLPGADGTLVRTEPLRLALSLPSLGGPLPRAGPPG
ncbi:Triacylglycerol lipase OS=Streptomyces fumanus OX=67302 GN=GCM10018772_18640 PE=3 SV=1 [Streptomyces fumanus]